MRCPSCGAEMVVRVARRGRRAGKKFYGCSRYPACRETLEIAEEASQAETHQLGSFDAHFPVDEPRAVEWLDARAGGPREYLYLPGGARLESVELPKEPEGIAQQVLQNMTLVEERFSSPGQPLPEAAQQVLAVLSKILTRGAFPTVSPWLEAAILTAREGEHSVELAGEPGRIVYRGPDEDKLPIQSPALLAPMLAAWHGPAPDLPYGSSEEERFHVDLMPVLLGEEVLRFVHPQAPLGALVGPEAEGERVDFLIAPPWTTPAVVEIDGEQHEAQTTRDEARDERLRQEGIEVLRIRAEQVRAGTGLQLQQFELLAQRLRGTRPSPMSKDDVRAWLAWAPVQATRFQLAVLHALRRGALLPGAPEWVLGIQEEDYETADLALHDLAVQVEALEDLYGVRVLPEAIRVVSATACSESPRVLPPRRLRTVIQTISEESFSRCPDLVLTSSASRTAHEVTEGMPPAWQSAPRLLVRPAPLPVRLRYESEGGSRARLAQTTQADSALDVLLQVLFRMCVFWDGQREALWRVLQGADALVLLPTGGGKSLIYQLGSLLLPGRAVIVDPIVALIDDQVSSLRELSIDRVGYITHREVQRGLGPGILQGIARGDYLFCFVAPERFQTEPFRQALQGLRSHSVTNVIVIDEAHCVSEWGHDFRTAYLNIARIAREYGEDELGVAPPILGLTGTASRAVLKDVRRELAIAALDAIITPKSFDRPELEFRILRAPTQEKRNALVGHLRALPGLLAEPSTAFFRSRGKRTASGIVFCPHVNGELGIAQVGPYIQSELGTQVGLYSGGAPRGREGPSWDEEKWRTAVLFKDNEVPLLTATKAFGMGIDKPNIRYTVHYGIPGSLEAFYQEAGRAGRDRRRAVCAVVFSDDYPDRSSDLLDPGRDLEELVSVYESIERATADDVARMLFFHLNAFGGIDEEIGWIRLAVSLIGNMDGPTVQDIPFGGPRSEKLLPRGAKRRKRRDTQEESRRKLEKALHRLVLLGVVSDYVVDYGGHKFTVRSAGIAPERMKQSVEGYVRIYNVARSREIRETLDAISAPSSAGFLEAAARILVQFIYDVIERGRRRALREIWLWARNERPDSGLRQGLLDYLQETEESTQIGALLDEAHIRFRDWQGLSEQVLSAREVGELQGQVVRFLESTPDHPGLLYLRALTEAITPGGNVDEVRTNLRAAIESMAKRYKEAVGPRVEAAWELLEGFELRAPSKVELALDVLETTRVSEGLATVCLSKARDLHILERAADWLLKEMVEEVEALAARHRCHGQEERYE